MNIRLIKDKEQYAAAMARLSALMTLDPKPGTPEDNELELLALVIEDYERKIVPPVVADPVEAILFRMDQSGLTRKDLIPYIGSMPKVSEVLSRKRPLSLSMIRRLHRGLGIPADVLVGESEATTAVVLEPETDYSGFPLKEMAERGCFGNIKGGAGRLMDRAEQLIAEFLREIGPTSREPALLRAPLHQRGARKADGTALLAWRLCVLKKARAIALPDAYRKGTITVRWLKDIARLSAFQDGPRLAKEALARAGIVLVIEPHFQGTYLDGAAMLDNGRPIVALTLRHDRLDNFWFALLHELVHVGKHLDAGHPFFADDLDSADVQDRIEREADNMAGNALIPADAWEKDVVRHAPTAKNAQALARELDIHPAIIAGRIRHETKNYRLLAKLLGQGEPGRQLA